MRGNTFLEVWPCEKYFPISHFVNDATATVIYIFTQNSFLSMLWQVYQPRTWRGFLKISVLEILFNSPRSRLSEKPSEAKKIGMMIKFWSQLRFPSLWCLRAPKGSNQGRIFSALFPLSSFFYHRLQSYFSIIIIFFPSLSFLSYFPSWSFSTITFFHCNLFSLLCLSIIISLHHLLFLSSSFSIIIFFHSYLFHLFPPHFQSSLSPLLCMPLS